MFIHMWSIPTLALKYWYGARKDFIGAALSKVPITMITLDDITRGIARGDFKLWEITENDEVIKGAFVTEVLRAGGGSAVNVIALGGKDMKSWLGDMLDALDKYRAKIGADAVIAAGRPGWKRTLERFGWTEGPTTMIKVA
jgi:hypothetical protein